MKSLFFMRHGPAVEKTSILYDDRDRPLTEDGIKRVSAAAKGLSKAAGDFDIILTSPLKRAFQTAALVAGRLDAEKKIEICSELAPRTSFNKLMQALERYKNRNRILLVGHEPDLSMAVSMLLGARNSSVQMKKGAVCRVDVDGLPPDGTAQLVWLMQPRALRLIGGRK